MSKTKRVIVEALEAEKTIWFKYKKDSEWLVKIMKPRCIGPNGKEKHLQINGWQDECSESASGRTYSGWGNYYLEDISEIRIIDRRIEKQFCERHPLAYDSRNLICICDHCKKDRH